MLGNIGCSTTIFATKGQTLCEANDQQQDGGQGANLRIGRQTADEEGGHAHDHNCDQEGVFPANEITQATEEQRTKRAHQKACGVSAQGTQQSPGVVTCGKEIGREKRRQRGVEIEVVPFKYGTGG
jgi:hypothetical protein